MRVALAALIYYLLLCISKYFHMEEKDAYAELASIRNLMERSAKFISLSGLSGIMAGIYALLGAGMAYKIVYGRRLDFQFRDFYINDPAIIWKLVWLALAVLVLSLGTGIYLTIRKANKKGENYWNPGSKRMLRSMLFPLVTGGLLILILLSRGLYEIISPVSLIFYGLAIVAASHYTYTDVKWLGIFEVILGLIAAWFPGYGLIFWTIGFGVLHIIYGTIMHFKYDR